MDDTTLAALEAALATSPGNPHLIGVLVQAHVVRGEPARGAALLASTPPELLAGDEVRAAASAALLSVGDAARALSFAAGGGPRSALARARALSSLGKKAEARASYAEAVAANPTLEDLELKAALGATEREVVPPEGPKLRVISNDPTDDLEVTRLLAPALPQVKFSDVGGLQGIKEQIRKRIILPFQKPSIFERFKKRVGGGILLYGPPGCGKTLLARATAGECGATFLNVAISDVLDLYIGESERKLHAIFDKARSSAPAVLFFDELEALAGKRQYSREGMSAKLVSQFLSEMDGFTQNNRGILVLGATNVPWAVDPAFRRPGRFDRVLFVPPPDHEGRLEILRLLLDARPHDGRISAEAIARGTSGHSGADLEGLVDAAADLAIARSLASGSEDPIRQEDLEAARKEIRSTALEWLTTARNHARYANEAGQYDEVLAFLAKHGK